MNDHSPKNTDGLEQPIDKVELTEEEASAVSGGQELLSLDAGYEVNIVTLAANFQIDLGSLDLTISEDSSKK